MQRWKLIRASGMLLCFAPFFLVGHTYGSSQNETVVVLWQASTEAPEDHAAPAEETETILWQALQIPVTPTPEAAPALSGPTVAPKDETAESETEETIPDPLEPINRAFFQFNDKFYFWALKPTASVYRDIFPQELRVSIRNFFSNLITPVRFANCLLQGELKCAGNEAVRFGLNTTFGFLGMIDQAKDKFDIERQDRDFGQTLGSWGFPALLYIEWPLLGPSNVRDSVGFVGDTLLDPRTYLLDRTTSIITRSVQIVNETSLRIGDYESLKKAAIDPYVAKRDAYNQYRENKIKKKR